jgi:hypothetical protein
MNVQAVFPFIAVLSIFTATVTAQVDGKFDFRAKFGAPLARETYIVPAGEMIVDYAYNGHVCRIQLPPTAPVESQSGGSGSKALDDFLLKLVPLDMRGRELGRMSNGSGLLSATSVEYENVIISGTHHGEHRTGVIVTFKSEVCHDQAAR